MPDLEGDLEGVTVIHVISDDSLEDKCGLVKGIFLNHMSDFRNIKKTLFPPLPVLPTPPPRSLLIFFKF